MCELTFCTLLVDKMVTFFLFKLNRVLCVKLFGLNERLLLVDQEKKSEGRKERNERLA